MAVYYTDMLGEDKRTPLHFACKGGNQETIQYIIKEFKFDASEPNNSAT